LRWRIEPALRAGSIDQAVAQFSKNGPEDLLALGRWLLQQGEAARVLEVIGAAEALSRQELFLVRLDALASLGRWEEIRQTIEKEKPPIKPLYAEVFQARAAKELGQLREANAHWTLALSHALPNLEQNLYLARYAEKMGEHRVAAKAWRQVARTPAWALRANLAALPSLEKDGDTRGLREAVQQLTRLAPNDPAPCNDAAYLDLLLQENVKAATATAEQLCHAHPEVLAYRTTLALAYLRTHRLAEALALYERVEVPWDKAPARSQAIHAAVLAASGRIEAPAVPDSALLLPEERALLRHPVMPR
jgi:tetratricopeptide (TPR) repeat protein